MLVRVIACVAVAMLVVALPGSANAGPNLFAGVATNGTVVVGTPPFPFAEYSGVLRHRDGDINVQALYDASVPGAPDRTVVLNLFADATFTATFDEITPLADNVEVWQGHIDGYAWDGTVAIAIENHALASAIVRADLRVFQFDDLGIGAAHKIVEVENFNLQGSQDFCAQDAVTPPPGAAAPGSGNDGAAFSLEDLDQFPLLGGGFQPLANENCWGPGLPAVKVKFVLAKPAADVRNSIRWVQAMLGEANISMRRTITLDPAWFLPFGGWVYGGAVKTNRAEFAVAKNALDNIRVDPNYGGGGAQRGDADLVVLIQKRLDDACGVAYANETGDPMPFSRAHAVVKFSCGLFDLALPHELGHLLGAYHDHFVEDEQDEWYPDQYGYTLVPAVPGFDVGAYDIMAYDNDCEHRDPQDGCFQTPNFASYKKCPFGQNFCLGVNNVANATEVLNLMAPIVCGYR